MFWTIKVVFETGIVRLRYDDAQRKGQDHEAEAEMRQRP